jgi:hypothetical protein
MILDNLTRAFKTQNWFAVATEFVIVIAGVVIGFQINAWNEGRIERASAEIARLRLIADLERDLGAYAVRERFFLEAREYGLFVVQAYSDPPPAAIEQQWVFLRAAVGASATWPFRPSGQVYRELQNDGRIELIADATLQEQLRDYYEDLAHEFETSVRFRSAYRDLVRGAVEPDLLAYITASCSAWGVSPRNVLPEGRRYLPSCPAPQQSALISLSTDRLHELATAQHEARLLTSNLDDTLQFVALLKADAEALIAELQDSAP